MDSPGRKPWVYYGKKMLSPTGAIPLFSGIFPSAALTGLWFVFHSKPRAHALGYPSAGPSGLLKCGFELNYLADPEGILGGLSIYLLDGQFL